MKQLCLGFFMLFVLCGCPRPSAQVGEQKDDLSPCANLEDWGYHLHAANGKVSIDKDGHYFGESNIPLYDSRRKHLLNDSGYHAVWPTSISFHVYTNGESPLFFVLYEWRNEEGTCLQYARLLLSKDGRLRIVDECPVGVTHTARLDKGERNTFVGFQYSIVSSSGDPFILVHFDGYFDTFKNWDLVMVQYSPSGHAIGVNIGNGQEVPSQLRLSQTVEQRRSYHWYGKFRFKQPNILEWNFETPIFNAYQVDVRGWGTIKIDGSPDFSLIPCPPPTPPPSTP